MAVLVQSRGEPVKPTPADERAAHPLYDEPAVSEQGMPRGVAELKGRRTAAGQAVTDMYLGLHVGEVFYGNVGSHERLDFTVIGPAVNEASRIAAMCRSVDQPVLISEAFAEVADLKLRLVSVGRYALLGVSHPQELFTIDPGARPS
jgi:adenylate cyclase